MKTASSLMRRSFAALLVIMGTMFTAQAQNNNDIPADVKVEIEKLNQQMEKSVQSKDFGKVIDLYSDEATIIAPGGKKIQGRKNIAEYWYSIGNPSSFKSEISELGGNSKMVYQLGRWTVTKTENGIEQTISTDVVLVWKRGSDFNYRIQLNSANNPVAINGKVVKHYEAAKP